MQPLYLRLLGADPFSVWQHRTFAAENIPGWATISDALKLTYTLHFGRVLPSTSAFLIWLGPGPRVADASTLTVVGQRISPYLSYRNSHGPVIPKGLDHGAGHPVLSGLPCGSRD